MPSGLFTQCLALLCSQAPPPDAVQSLLGRLAGFSPVDGSDRGWLGAGRQWTLPLPGELPGRVVVDVVPEPWPDGMGDAASDVPLLAAWSMGFMGPYSRPGALKRSLQYTPWDDAAGVVESHAAVVRVRTTWAAGGELEVPPRPEGYDPVAELAVATQVAVALLAAPGALAFFNPAGEVVLPPDAARQALGQASGDARPPYELWSNLRLTDVEQGRWLLMDTVGMEQLDSVDHEAVFPAYLRDPDQVAGLLRDASLEQAHLGRTVEPGQVRPAADGTRWRAQVCGEALLAPARPTVRWLPEDAPEAPARLRECSPRTRPREARD